MLEITSPPLMSDLQMHDLEMLLTGGACCGQHIGSWELELSSEAR